MIDRLKALGLKIEKRCIDKSNNFQEICVQELEAFSHDLSLNDFEKRVSKSILARPSVRQLNLHNTFGQPPLTVFNNNKFVIDIYFWLHHDTSIHDHSFEGAFKVLFGSSLQETYKVTIEKKFSADVAQTILEKKSSQFLYQNDVVKITRGDIFTHRLIHLEVPTITLCIRSINDQSKKQWHHFSNGLSIEKKIIPEQTLKSFYYTQYLQIRDKPDFKATLKSLITNLDTSVVMNFYEQIATQSLPFNEEFCESFYNSLSEIYKDQPWFKTYQDFYKILDESYLEFHSDSAIMRIIEHAYNTKISKAETLDIIDSYKSFQASPDELKLIESIL